MIGGHPTRFVLASASPARLRLLLAAGIEPAVVVSGVDESVVQLPDAAALCATLAELKAVAVAANEGDALVLGCDSALDFGGQVLGKPVDGAEAHRRWLQLAGGTGVLYTGHCLIDAGTGRRFAEVSSTRVRFGRPTPEELAAYIASGEPMRVAGAFTIDGLGAPFVEGIEGDHGTVVGLSLPVLRRLLARHDVAITRLWASP